MSETPGAVDVARLMEEIKERVRQRKATGFYSEEEVRRISQLELEFTDAFPGPRWEIEDRLARLNEAWDVLAPPEIVSHRRRFGPLLIRVKRWLYRLTRPYIGVVLNRQLRFNSELVRLLNPLVVHVHDRLEEFSRRGEDLALSLHEKLGLLRAEADQRHRQTLARLAALEADLTRLREALEQVRAPAAPLRLPPPPVAPPGGTLAPEAYLRFEDRHRGSPEEIRARQRAYLACFPRGPVLDLGCGRGEFLELCREAGLPARGVDVDPAMVDRCRAAGLDVEQADALAYLEALPDGSLGGVFAAQLIEHLAPEAFVALVQLAYARLGPGGVLVLETPNPRCLGIFASAFYVDLSHVKPIHPEAAVFVLEAAGFRDVEVRYLNPCPPEARLRPLEPEWYMRRYELALIQAINDNLARLNDLLYGPQDYAVIGRKP